MLYFDSAGISLVRLTLRRNMRIRNRAVIVMVLPVALILWMVGWVLYWKASHVSGQANPSSVKDDGLEISLGMLEEELEYGA